jgi:hypothetical protein
MKAHRDSIAELSALTEALVEEHRAEEARYRSILEGQPVARRRAARPSRVPAWPPLPLRWPVMGAGQRGAHRLHHGGQTHLGN